MIKKLSKGIVGVLLVIGYTYLVYEMEVKKESEKKDDNKTIVVSRGVFHYMISELERLNQYELRMISDHYDTHTEVINKIKEVE